MRGIVYKMDYTEKKALVRIMIDQDQSDFPLANYKPIDINHVYVPFDFIGNGETDIELGSIIEILEIEDRCVPTGIDYATMLTDKRMLEITAYSVVSVERTLNQLVTVTSCESNYLKVAGEAYGSFSGMVGYPRNCDLIVWRNLAKGSFLYGDVIELPKFDSLFINEQQSMEIYFDHKARLEAQCGKKPTSFGQKLLTRIRLLTFSEIEEIYKNAMHTENGSSELAGMALIRMFENEENPDIQKYLKIMEENSMHKLKETLESHLIELSNTRNLCDLVDFLEMAHSFDLEKLVKHIDDWLVELFTSNMQDVEYRNEIFFYCLEATQYCYLPAILSELEKFFYYLLSHSLNFEYKSMVNCKIWNSSLSEMVSSAEEFDDRIASFACYMFDNEDEFMDLDQYLHFAHICDIQILKDHISNYLAVDLQRTHSLKNVTYAVQYNLEEFENELSIFLRDCDLCDLSTENKKILLQIYGEGKEFILRKMMRLDENN